MSKLTVRDIEVGGKRVLVRVDFNVPLDEAGAIMDDGRIRAALPTIEYLIGRGARLILCSHLGRPDGGVVEGLRLAVVARRLSQLIGRPVATTRDCIGPEVEAAVAGLKDEDVLLLENLRFHPEEEKNDAAFAQALAKLADIYVDDAFGTAHRAHASVVGVTRYLPAVSGLLLEQEMINLGRILKDPPRPLAALLGGAKVSDKVGMIENIMAKVDYILVGGGMAATFLKAKAYRIGKSLLEADRVATAAELLARAEKSGVTLMLPLDVVVTGEITPEAEGSVVSIEGIPDDRRIVDIGPETIKSFQGALAKCQAVFWNGPMGIYEIPQFAQGTKALARFLAGLEATTVIGGGSTADAVAEMGLADRMSFVSTGGGASLDFLSGKVLPGIEVLPDKEA
ncbi:MAG: phosphoglycerate kinase [Dehalococcoidales bacterium]|nr:phosphoglycerate kinase [Dehalococcoidales bacterium]